MTEQGEIRGDNVFFRLFRTQQTMRQLFARAIEGSGVAGDEYAVLSIIAVRGPLPPTEVAALLGMPATTVSVHVTRFLERGLVRRRPNPEDGRSYLLETTPRARKVFQVVAPRIRELVGELAELSAVPLAEIEAALTILDDAGRLALDRDTTNV